MWDEIVKNLADFPSAVLTAIDSNGFPFSVRCRPVPDQAQQRLRIELADTVPVQAGPASLLCHYHDEQLWNLKGFNMRGRLEQVDGGWQFQPLDLLGSGAAGGLSSIFKARGQASRYLKKRGLARPSIPWDDYKALRKEAKASG